MTWFMNWMAPDSLILIQQRLGEYANDSYNIWKLQHIRSSSRLTTYVVISVLICMEKNYISMVNLGIHEYPGSDIYEVGQIRNDLINTKSIDTSSHMTTVTHAYI